MKKKGVIALGLGLVLLTVPAAAAQEPETVAAPAGSGCVSTITVNGKNLGEVALPDGQSIPARLLAEADYGFADWYPEEGQGMFSLEGYGIDVTFATGAIEINGEALESVTAQVKDGVTYLPASVIDGLEGYEVNLNPELDVYRIDITTPNGSPLAQLAYQVREASDANANNKVGAGELAMYGLEAEDFTEVVGLFPMNISPDTVLVGKVAEGKLDSVKTALEAYRKAQEDTFSWYLAQNLPKVQDARLEVAGDYLLFLIGEKADEGVALFQSTVESWTEAE